MATNTLSVSNFKFRLRVGITIFPEVHPSYLISKAGKVQTLGPLTSFHMSFAIKSLKYIPLIYFDDKLLMTE